MGHLAGNTIRYLNSPADATRDLVCGGRGIVDNDTC